MTQIQPPILTKIIYTDAGRIFVLYDSPIDPDRYTRRWFRDDGREYTATVMKRHNLTIHPPEAFEDYYAQFRDH